MYKDDSMLEIAIQLMEKKRSPQTIEKIAEEVFTIKGLKINENLEKYSQFINDFMLSGYFISCKKDDKDKGVKFDLKRRQKYDVLSKDGDFVNYDDKNDEVSKAELGAEEVESPVEEEVIDENTEVNDDIEKELENAEYYDVDDEDGDEDSYDDDNDITIKK